MLTKERTILLIIPILMGIVSPLFAQNETAIADSTAQKIILQFEKQYGFIPQPFQVLAERSGAVQEFFQYGKILTTGGPLTPREINLVTLSAAVALKSPGCTANQIRKLRKMGVSNKEILQAVVLSAVLANTSTLSEVSQVLIDESVTNSINP